MSRFVNIPNQDEGTVLLINSDHVKQLLCVDERVYITMKKDEQIVCEFDTPEDARAFLEKNFILFNK